MLKAIAIMTIIGFSSSAHALNLQGFKFSDSYRYSFLEDSGIETFNGPLVLTTSYAHIATPLFVTDSQVKSFKSELINRYDLLTLGVGYRINPEVAFSLDTAFLKAKIDSKNISGLGDTALRAKFTLLKDSSSAFSLNPNLNFATGKENNFTTSKSLGFGIRAIYEKSWDNLHFLGSLGFSHANKNEYQIINYRNLLLSALGISLDLSELWNLNFEINRNFTLVSDYRQDEGDFYITLKNKTFSQASTYFGAGVAGFDKIDRKNWTVFAGLKMDFFGEKTSPPVYEEKVKEIVEAEPEQVRPVAIKSRSDEKKLGKVFALENIFFENNKIKINSTEMIKMNKLLVTLIENRNNIKHIVIEGFASRVGDTAKNQVLSQKRAQEVQSILVERGIAKEITSIVAFGDQAEKQYKDVNKNRRVQFRIYLNKK